MKILIIGATGTIGREVVKALSRGNEIVEVSRSHTPLTVDLADPASIRTLLGKVGKVDAIVSAAGNAQFKPLSQLTDDDFRFSLDNKLMGQVNLVRLGVGAVNDGGSITVTSGVLAQKPMPGTAAISLVNAALEGFGRAAALEAPRNIRINVVSPPWAVETLRALNMDLSIGIPAERIAQAYVQSVTGTATGNVISPA